MDTSTHKKYGYRLAIFTLIIVIVAGIGCKNDSTGPTTDTTNLIANSSFELNNKPSYVGWHFVDSADTAVSEDVPLLGGTWSLLMYPKWLPAPWARAYITGESGRRVYELSVWAKTANLADAARISCGILQADKTLRNEVHVNISATEWTFYTVQDTLNVEVTDTIVVELSPGGSEVVPLDAQALFDLVRLQRIF